MSELLMADLDVAEVEVIVDQHLKPGTKVEVRSRFEGRWSHGFEVAEVVPDGYRVKRLSDGSVLPTAFAADDVRAARKKGMWWY